MVSAIKENITIIKNEHINIHHQKQPSVTKLPHGPFCVFNIPFCYLVFKVSTESTNQYTSLQRTKVRLGEVKSIPKVTEHCRHRARDLNTGPSASKVNALNLHPVKVLCQFSGGTGGGEEGEENLHLVGGRIGNSFLGEKHFETSPDGSPLTQAVCRQLT